MRISYGRVRGLGYKARTRNNVSICPAGAKRPNSHKKKNNNVLTGVEQSKFKSSNLQMGDIGSCSHSRSYELYLASLETPCPATQVTHMGHLNPSICTCTWLAWKPSVQLHR